jgi:uncharacterized protein with HEPN domain
MKSSPRSDEVLLRHMLECLDNIDADTGRDRARFFGSRMVRDAVLRNLQTLTESSQRLGDAIKAAEPATRAHGTGQGRQASASTG